MERGDIILVLRKIKQQTCYYSMGISKKIISIYVNT